MKISVIVPVYNNAAYLARCLDSIIGQTHKDLEIICINDGSTDKSGQILDAYAQCDSRICVIHQENFGVSVARNVGVSASTGDFITFVDSDDAIEPDMYALLLGLFDADDIDIVHCGYKRIRLDGGTKEVSGTGAVYCQTSEEAASCLLLGQLFVGSLWNKLYRRSVIAPVRSDPTLAINEDVLVNAEAFKGANKIIFWDICKYLFYENTESTTARSRQEKKILDCISAAEKILALYSGTAVEPAAAERLFTTLTHAYRFHVLSGVWESRTVRKELSEQIAEILQKYNELSVRKVNNYRLMRSFPRLYRFVYTIYDKKRIPNYDV